MSKARTQPSAKTGLVFKISIALFFLLAIVLYSLNDYFKQEKWILAQAQLRSQIVSTKTAVSSQLNQLKNILSSFEAGVNESKINWVQLDPFFGIAKGQKVNNALKLTQYIGRSGSMGERWNVAYLEKALSLRKISGDDPITVQIFRDKQGGKYLAINFAEANNNSTVVVGSADYFQKYFDLNRGGKMTSLLKTMDNVLAGHSDADYVATLTDDSNLLPKKYLIEKEEIAGTNLVAVNYIAKSSLATGFVIPWSVVGLITGFGFILVGLLFYGIDPIEKRVERYRKQEREQIFKETLQDSLVANTKPASSVDKMTANSIISNKISDVPPPNISAQKSQANEFTEDSSPVDMAVSSTTLQASIQQALFNVERVLKSSGVFVEKNIYTTLSYDIPNKAFIRNFENLMTKTVEILVRQHTANNSKIIVRLFDIEQSMTVLEIKFTAAELFDVKNLKPLLNQVEQSGAMITIEKAEPQGVLVKAIMKQATVAASVEKETVTRADAFAIDDSISDIPTYTLPDEVEASKESDDIALDLDAALSLDDFETESSQEIQAALTSTKFNTDSAAPNVQKPEFALSKKDFKVDNVKVNIRRPNRTGQGQA